MPIRTRAVRRRGCDVVRGEQRWCCSQTDEEGVRSRIWLRCRDGGWNELYGWCSVCYCRWFWRWWLVNYSIPPCLHSHVTFALFIYAYGKITFSSPPSCCEIFWYAHNTFWHKNIFKRNAFLLWQGESNTTEHRPAGIGARDSSWEILKSPHGSFHIVKAKRMGRRYDESPELLRSRGLTYLSSISHAFVVVINEDSPDQCTAQILVWFVTLVQTECHVWLKRW